MRTSIRIKHFIHHNFLEWHDSLIREAFIYDSKDESANTFYLKTPLKIILTKKVISSLQKRYKTEYEIGGILLAEPVRIESNNVLLIDGVRYIQNLSCNPERSYQRKQESYNKYIRTCLNGTIDGKRYLPLTFHTHPRGSDEADILETYFQMSTSKADQKFSRKILTFSAGGNEINLTLPSILCLVTNSDGVFIGAYGGKIAPDNFKEYSEKILGKTINAAIDWGFGGESFLKKLLSVLTSMGIGFLSYGLQKGNYQARSLAMQLVMSRKQTETDNNFFTIANNEEAVINLPKLESS